jgi:hypothetical protein
MTISCSRVKKIQNLSFCRGIFYDIFLSKHEDGPMRIICAFLILICTASFKEPTITERIRSFMLDAFDDNEDLEKLAQKDVLLVGAGEDVFPMEKFTRPTLQRHYSFVEKRPYDLIFAYHPHVSDLWHLKEMLKPGGKCYIYCHPLESYHWDFVYRMHGVEGLALNAKISHYSDEIYKIGLVREHEYFGRVIAEYENEFDFIDEVRRNQTIWGIPWWVNGTDGFSDFARYAPRTYVDTGLGIYRIQFWFEILYYVLRKPMDTSNALLLKEAQ